MKKNLLKIQLILSLLFFSTAGFAQVVISQVYGGGGNTGATYTHDYVELFNSGTETINIGGWSIQYSSAGGNSWSNHTVLPDFALQPGQYYLVQQAQGTGGTSPLPTPDLVPSSPITMSATNLKILLANDAVIVTGENPTSSNIMDKVGFGSATGFEEAAAPVLSNTTAGFRSNNGCQDTNNNAADFTTAAPEPRNSVSPLNVCAQVVFVTITTEGGVPAEIDEEAGTLQLFALVEPEETSQEVIWTITNGAEYASVNANGLVTAVANGTVTVRATSVAAASAFDQIEITITNQPVIIPVTVSIETEEGVEAAIATDDGVLQLIAIVTPEETSQEVVWSVTTGGSFASVSTDGIVTALANGTATIRATSVADNTAFDEINVVISNQVINAVSVVVATQSGGAAVIVQQNGTLQLIATVNPSGANQAVVWSVQSGASFVSISQGGLVTALANGTATVRATSVQDNTIFGQLEVEVDYEIISVEETSEVTLQMFPNPTNGLLNLTSTEALREVMVYDLLGQLIVSSNSQKQIDLSAYENGVYIVKAKTVSGKTITRSVVKN